jgi:hypothetical protein
MKLVSLNDEMKQLEQILLNLSRVLSKFKVSREFFDISDVYLVLFYYTKEVDLELIRERINHEFKNAICVGIQVSGLPKQARIELEIRAYKGRIMKNENEVVIINENEEK